MSVVSEMKLKLKNNESKLLAKEKCLDDMSSEHYVQSKLKGKFCTRMREYCAELVSQAGVS